MELCGIMPNAQCLTLSSSFMKQLNFEYEKEFASGYELRISGCYPKREAQNA
jgi:hypothetical protein